MESAKKEKSVKADVFSGFLGAGKTTLLNKLIREAYLGERLVIIENEFGAIPVDDLFLEEAGVKIRALAEGCICCSLQGNFRRALRQAVDELSPDRVLIEASGVAELSVLLSSMRSIREIDTGSAVTVVDASRCETFLNKLGAFYKDQIMSAGTLILSRVQSCSPARLENTLSLLRELNPEAPVIKVPWDEMDGAQIRDVMTSARISCAGVLDPRNQLIRARSGNAEWDSCAFETDVVFSASSLKKVLCRLREVEEYGRVVRTKGRVLSSTGSLSFDTVLEEYNIRPGNFAPAGKVCVIGTSLNNAAIQNLFQAET